jgi:Fe2+ or Zn2+ uptake regulation protein
MLTHDDHIVQALRKHHISVTANRVKVLRTAYQLKKSISTAAVQKAIGYTIERTSIHRSLRLFCEKGFLVAVPNTTGLIEYNVPDPGTNCKAEQKATFICSQCGKMHETLFTKAIRKVPKDFSVAKVIIEGVCEQCSS